PILVTSRWTGHPPSKRVECGFDSCRDRARVAKRQRRRLQNPWICGFDSHLAHQIGDVVSIAALPPFKRSGARATRGRPHQSALGEWLVIVDVLQNVLTNLV